MSTRSNIAKVNPDGSCRMVYCHSDGCPSYNGRVLLEHYQEEAKIDALLDQGDLSCLGAEIGEKHDFDDWDFWSTNDQCRFYARDRGETDVQARNFNGVTHPAVESQLCEQEYLYIRRPDGKWYWYDHGTPMGELTLAACR